MNPEAITEKVVMLGDCVCEDIERSEVIIYEGDLQKLLLSDLEESKARFIISSKDFLKRTNPFAISYEKSQNSFSAVFNSESVSEVTRILEEGIESVFDENSFSDLNRYLKLISLELIQNALIFGRSQEIRLNVDFSIFRGKDSYRIEVKDHYGMLDRETFFSSIRRAYKEKTYEIKESGAGLGLSMVLSASDELAINRKEGEFTQISSIISKYKRLKEYKNKKTSLSFLEAL